MSRVCAGLCRERQGAAQLPWPVTGSTTHCGSGVALPARSRATPLMTSRPLPTPPCSGIERLWEPSPQNFDGAPQQRLAAPRPA